MPALSVRASERLLGRLDAAAAEHGITRTRMVRQMLEAALRDRPTLAPEPPGAEELLALLSEAARRGNVGAIKTLLLREQTADPAERALLALEQLAEGRR